MTEANPTSEGWTEEAPSSRRKRSRRSSRAPSRGPLITALITAGLAILLASAQAFQLQIGGAAAYYASGNQTGSDSFVETSVPLQIFHIATYLICVGWLALTINWDRLRSAAIALWPMFLFWSLTFISFSWSVEPQLTIQRSLIYLLSFSIILLFLTLFEPDEAMKRVVIALAAITIPNLLVIILFPAAGIHQADELNQSVHAGSWRGIFIHRSTFGQLCALTGALICFSPPKYLFNSFVKWGLFALNVLFVIQSKSGGAIASLVGVTGGMFLIRVIMGLPRNNRPIAIGLVLLATLVVGILGPQVFGLILAALGKDPGLTGRAGAWAVMFDLAKARPILGYGFSAWLKVIVGPVLQATGSITAPHNGYIEVMLSCGLLGLSALALLLFTYARRMLVSINQAVSETDKTTVVLASGVLIYILEMNMVETNLIKANNIHAAILMIGLGVLGLKIANPTTLVRRRRRLPTEQQPSVSPAAPNPSIIDLEGGGSR